MSRWKVVVTDDRFGSYREEEGVLGKIDASLEVKNLGSAEEAVSVCAQADGILVNLFPLTAEVISRLERCRVISRYGVGFDNVDVKAATEKKIWVSRVPDYSLEDVSDQALALLLACVRKVTYKDSRIREGKWNLYKDLPTRRIAGKTLGLVGYGAIARCLHRKVSGFGLARVLVTDPYVDASVIEKTGAKAVDLATLLAESDFISLHTPLMPDTRHLIGEKAFAGMRKTPILINTSRGPIVDEEALAAALKAKKISGAGLDVFEKEPLPSDSPLRSFDTVVLSDHAGWYSEESIVELKTKAARNVAAVLAGGKPAYPVNGVGG
jgi:D-3-phosphoglycerate dehydrogenase